LWVACVMFPVIWAAGALLALMCCYMPCCFFILSPMLLVSSEVCAPPQTLQTLRIGLG
jgi:hypothetical protein